MTFLVHAIILTGGNVSFFVPPVLMVSVHDGKNDLQIS